MRELAKELGVSPSAVSMALNDKKGISAATKKRILDHIAGKGYTVATNRTRGQQERRGLMIAFLQRSTMDLADSYLLSSLVPNLESVAEKSGFTTSIKYIRPEELPNFSPRTDAVIFWGTAMNQEDLPFISQAAFPFVVLDCPLHHFPVNSVCMDNRGGVRAAIENLIVNGHKRIGYLRAKGVLFLNYKERFQEYTACLEERGLPKADIIELPNDLNMACAEMNRWLGENEPIRSTAFVADNSSITCGAATALENYGVRIGEDISLICFDNSSYAEAMGITAIAISEEQLAKAAIDLLVNNMEHPEWPAAHCLVGTRLISRRSVKTIL